MKNITTSDIQSRIRLLKQLAELQKEHGNWNYDPYNHGYANGLILALSVMEHNDAEFLDPPLVYLRDLEPSN